MTTAEIFSQIAAHQIKGMMIHEQLANYYDFLGLKGYKRMHEYHYLKESCEYRCICRYYINHYNRLVPYADVENPDVIPEIWYNYTRQDVDITTKKNAVKNGFIMWESWEKETKDLYEKMYKELMAIDEIAAANKVMELVCDVDCELKKAEREVLEMKAIDYDMTVIIAIQGELHKKYCKKQEEIGVKIC